MRYFYSLILITATILLTIKPGLATQIIAATLAVIGILLLIPDEDATK